jgi:hypothetical protein
LRDPAGAKAVRYEPLAVGVQPDQPLAQLDRSAEDLGIARQRNPRPGDLELGGEARRVARRREDRVAVGEEFRGLDLEQVEEPGCDVRSGGGRVAPQRDDVLPAEGAAEVVHVWDQMRGYRRGPLAEQPS